MFSSSLSRIHFTCTSPFIDTLAINTLPLFRPFPLISSSGFQRQTTRAFTSRSNILFASSSSSGKKSSPSSAGSVVLKRRSFKVSVTPLEDRFKMEWPKITLFGDSITRRSMDPDHGCWGSMIAYKAGSYFDVDVRGFEGYNTCWALELMPKLFPKSYLDKVEIFVPFFGHNDSWDKDPIRVPVEKFESNLRAIIKYVVEHGLEKRKIIMITPTWYDREAFDKYMESTPFPPLHKTLEHATKYSEAVKRIAKEEDIAMVDFFEFSKKHQPLREMFCDGVHYSREGARMLFEQLMPIIEKKLEASFKKPLADMWHIIPVDQRDDVKAVLTAKK